MGADSSFQQESSLSSARVKAKKTLMQTDLLSQTRNFCVQKFWCSKFWQLSKNYNDSVLSKSLLHFIWHQSGRTWIKDRGQCWFKAGRCGCHFMMSFDDTIWKIGKTIFFLIRSKTASLISTAHHIATSLCVSRDFDQRQRPCWKAWWASPVMIGFPNSSVTNV